MHAITTIQPPVNGRPPQCSLPVASSRGCGGCVAAPLDRVQGHTVVVAAAASRPRTPDAGHAYRTTARLFRSLLQSPPPPLLADVPIGISGGWWPGSPATRPLATPDGGTSFWDDEVWPQHDEWRVLGGVHGCHKGLLPKLRERVCV